MNAAASILPHRATAAARPRELSAGLSPHQDPGASTSSPTAPGAEHSFTPSRLTRQRCGPKRLLELVHRDQGAVLVDTTLFDLLTLGLGELDRPSVF